MSNIEKITTSSELLAYIRDEARPNGNLSIRGVAKLAGVEHTSIIRGGVFSSDKLSEKLTAQGFDAGALSVEGFPPKAVVLTLEYFAYESKVKSEEPRKLLLTFSTIGLMETLQQLNPERIDLKSFQSMLETVIKQNNEQKEAIQLILAEKSEKETLGELVGENFPKIPELLSFV